MANILASTSEAAAAETEDLRRRIRVLEERNAMTETVLSISKSTAAEVQAELTRVAEVSLTLFSSCIAPPALLSRAESNLKLKL